MISPRSLPGNLFRHRGLLAILALHLFFPSTLLSGEEREPAEATAPELTESTPAEEPTPPREEVTAPEEEQTPELAAPENEEVPTAPAVEKSIVAQVGQGTIDMDTMMESWFPVWHNLMLDGQLRKISPEDMHQKLQDAWTKSLESAIREEIFYRESLLQMDSTIEKIAKAQFQRSEAGNGGDSYSRVQQEVRARYLEHVDEYVQAHIDEATKRAGGIEELQKVIARQGIDFEDWKRRIRRKTLTQIHLNNHIPLYGIADPGPGDIRKFYKENPLEFSLPGKSVFRHIFISFERRGGEEDARDFTAQLFPKLDGTEATFEKLAALHSDDEFSAKLGGIDPLPGEDKIPEALSPKRQAWLDEVRRAVIKLPAGKQGPVMLSNHGCHMLYIIRQEEGEKIPFEKAQESILEKLKSRKREQMTLHYYATLRKEVRVEIRQAEYPARYAWKKTEGGEP